MFLEQDSTLVISPLAYGAGSDPSHAAHQFVATSSGSADMARSATRSAWLVSSRGGLGHFPVKCYVCIVAMGTAVPLAVNVLLQDIAKQYCNSKGMTPEECDPIRFSEFRPSNSIGGQCRFTLRQSRCSADRATAPSSLLARAHGQASVTPYPYPSQCHASSAMLLTISSPAGPCLRHCLVTDNILARMM
jgi:hypothetical protein